MLSSRAFKSVAFSLGLLASSLASAAPVVTYSGGVAVGVEDLVVGGQNYDVSFRFGSYNAVFASETPIFLEDATGATAAANALLAVLNAESEVRIGSGGGAGLLWVPFADSNLGDPSRYLARHIGYQDGTGSTWQDFGNFEASKSDDFTTFRNWGFALFTADPENGVPEPGSLALAGVALAGLCLPRRRRAISSTASRG